MNKTKWLTTMNVFDEYERRFANARAEKEFADVLSESKKRKIIEDIKKVLSFRDELIPEICDAQEVESKSFSSYDVSQLRYTTWENFYGCASLYMPKGDEKVPLVFIFCGHAISGRLSKSYVTMAHRLASMGIAVVVADNIGQGDREFQGHKKCIAPFYCGLTLQGMIVMETVAIVNYMKAHPRVDKTKIGSCGNSGGGTLNVFAAALIDDIKVLSASGYPSEFSYIFSKERRHCECNLLPGIIYGPEMWEILSVFAPKPILLEQGEYDHLIPIDLAWRNARKTQNIYVQLAAQNNFSFISTPTKHPWDAEDIEAIGDFLGKNLGADISKALFPSDEDVKSTQIMNVDIPKSSFTTDEISQIITGIKMPEGTELADVFPPKYKGRKLSSQDVADDVGRGNVMRIFAQMECALKKERDSNM